MTKAQVLWLVAVGVVVAAALVTAHLVMPFEQTWAVNRIVHHGWEAVAGLAAAGGIVWMWWPRPAARRRDEQRLQAHRRVIAMGAVVLAGVILVVFAEVHRDLASRDRLGASAVADLEAIGKALDAYAADHDGAEPAALGDLAPKYLEAARLYYVYRHGPAEAPPPAAAVAEAPAEAPSYAIARIRLAPDAKKRPETRLRAYLRPGLAWAPLTAVLGKDGKAHVAGDDEVRLFEKQFAESHP